MVMRGELKRAYKGWIFFTAWRVKTCLSGLDLLHDWGVKHAYEGWIFFMIRELKHAYKGWLTTAT